MKKKQKNTVPDPTKAELEILKVLWQLGPATVRAVNDHLNKEKKEVQYTTTLKFMQLMTEKGLLKRNEEAVSHIYSPALQEKKMKIMLLSRFVQNLYEVSPSQVLMQLWGNQKPSKKEIKEIKSFLDSIDK